MRGEIGDSNGFARAVLRFAGSGGFGGNNFGDFGFIAAKEFGRPVVDREEFSSGRLTSS